MLIHFFTEISNGLIPLHICIMYELINAQKTLDDCCHGLPGSLESLLVAHQPHADFESQHIEINI